MTIYEFLKRTKEAEPREPTCGYCGATRGPMHTDQVLRSVGAVLCGVCYKQFMEEQVGKTR
jgi:hypothetical protein